jgi:succinate dehydrogenase/fumarate reductase flavoprotein subunit
MIRLEPEPLITEVLVVGGGIGGLMAAINAARNGAQVVVAEKANTKRSGSGATGNDHFACYIPEVHGGDIEPIITENLNSLHGDMQDMPHVVRFLEHSFERVQDWHSWGINMKPHGEWDFSGHAFPGRPRMFLKYAGNNQKEVLTKQAKKAGAKIINHLPIIDVLTEGGRVVGALGLRIGKDEPVLQVIQAKAVILTTGTANRLYPPAANKGYMFNVAFCPACTGAGRAAAYRAGARLVNMEMPNRHAGPKLMSRCGKATWIGVLRDPHGEAVGPFVTKPTRRLGDITADVWNSVFSDMMKSGRGPTYMDCTGISEEDMEYMRWGFTVEGDTSLLDNMDREGVDLRRHMVEFMQYEPFLIGCRGIDIGLDGQTSLPGLYAAGDEVGNFRADISGAASFGWFAGEHAAKAVKDLPQADAAKNQLVEQKRQMCSEFMDRGQGASWKEANVTLQMIMQDYAGVEVRSESLLKAGLKYLGDLKAMSLAGLQAENSHSLMRCLEALDLMDCGEMIMHSALARKESRGRHHRSDYTFTNPLLANKFVTIQQVDGKIETGLRDKDNSR